MRLKTARFSVYFLIFLNVFIGVNEIYIYSSFANDRNDQVAKIIPPKEVKVINKKAHYFLMVTSLDSYHIGSTPFMDVAPDTIRLLNSTPFNGVALALMDANSAQPIVPAVVAIEKAKELKMISKKDIWPRVNINRMYQRNKKHPCFKSGYNKNDVAKLAVQGLRAGRTAEISTPYFANIKLLDIYDDEKALTNFYKIWTLALKTCKILGPGVVLDLENYGWEPDGYKVSALAAQYGRLATDVISKLEEIGAHLVAIAEKECPDATILNLFTYHNAPNYDNDYYPIPAYISHGMLKSIKERRVSLKLIDGGEAGLGYVNTILDSLKKKIEARSFSFADWLQAYPDNFQLGGTITVWDDPSKIRGWVKRHSGDNSPFASIEDFKPFMKELFLKYDFVWFYVPSVADYNPFSPMVAFDFNRKLKIVINDVIEHLHNDPSHNK